MRHDILKVYPQLGDVEIEYAWSGTMAYAVHKMPQIGELAPGYWLASAFGGHGLNTTAMAGEMIARAILDGDDRWRLFSPYELVWAGGRLGPRRRADVVLVDAVARCTLQEKIARYRDRARREAEARQAQWEAEKAARKAAEEARRAEEAADASPRRKRAAPPPRRPRGLRPSARARPRRRRGWRAEEAQRIAEEAQAAKREAGMRAAAAQAMQDAADAAAALAQADRGAQGARDRRRPRCAAQAAAAEPHPACRDRRLQRCRRRAGRRRTLRATAPIAPRDDRRRSRAARRKRGRKKNRRPRRSAAGPAPDTGT